MTPKEKAIELVEDYRNAYPTYTSNRLNLHQAKRCALIAVDLLIAEMYEYDSCYYDNYYFEVKKEIENL
jgi:hypothetical protein